MSSGGDCYLGDGPSYLTYEDKICSQCENITKIKVSHSNRNPNKLYYWCDTHEFVDWCLPTNVETMNLTYEGKICPQCENFTNIRVSHSYRNPNKLYYWCDTHTFVDWCLPTKVGTMNPSVEEKSAEKREMDHDIKIGLKNKLLELNASCRGSSISSLLFIAFLVVIAFAVFTLIAFLVIHS